MTDIDREVTEEYLDNAAMHAAALNAWAEGFWIGRALEHADQNAIPYEWLAEQFKERGLDAGVIAVPKLVTGDPRSN